MIDQICAAEEECDQTKIVGQGLCDRHYRMNRIYGRTKRVNRKHGQGSITSDGYPVTKVNGQYKMTHIIVAEKALGKPLPPKAIVHHISGIPGDHNGFFKLVICPSQAYHMLIHKLMRQKGISFKKGWPNEN